MYIDTRQTDGNGTLLLSYSRGPDTSRKYDIFDYYTSLAYDREVIIPNFVDNKPDENGKSNFSNPRRTKTSKKDEIKLIMTDVKNIHQVYVYE